MKKKLLVSLLALSMTSSMLAGCGGSGNSIDSKEQNEVIGQEEIESVEEDNAEDVAEAEQTESEVENEVEGAEDEKIEAPESSPASAELSSDWKSMQVQVDGKVLTLPCDYSEIEALGYTMDLSVYESEEDYTLEPNYYAMTTVKTVNKDGDVLKLGFINNGDVAKKFNECQVYEIKAEWNLREGAPDIVLPGGITWGTPLEEVETAYGNVEEDEIYVSDLGYKGYTYEVGSFQKVKLNIYTDEPEGKYDGVANIDITCQGE